MENLYKNIEFLCCTPEANIMLYISFTSIKKKRTGKLYCYYIYSFRMRSQHFISWVGKKISKINDINSFFSRRDADEILLSKGHEN